MKAAVIWGVGRGFSSEEIDVANFNMKRTVAVES